MTAPAENPQIETLPIAGLIPAARSIESAHCHRHAATITNIHDPAKGAKDLKKVARNA